MSKRQPHNESNNDTQYDKGNGATVKKFPGLINTWNGFAVIAGTFAAICWSSHIIISLILSGTSVSLILVSVHFELKEHYQKKYRYIASIIGMACWLVLVLIIQGIVASEKEKPKQESIVKKDSSTSNLSIISHQSDSTKNKPPRQSKATTKTKEQKERSGSTTIIQHGQTNIGQLNINSNLPEPQFTINITSVNVPKGQLFESTLILNVITQVPIPDFQIKLHARNIIFLDVMPMRPAGMFASSYPDIRDSVGIKSFQDAIGKYSVTIRSTKPLPTPLEKYIGFAIKPQ
jgi:hypothetical protein